MIKFEVGQTYYTRSVGDHNCIITAQIVARTAKQVTAIVRGKEQRFGVKVLGVSDVYPIEAIMPWGRHSMAPMIDATDTKILVPDWER